MEFLVRPIVYVEEFPNRDARVKAWTESLMLLFQAKNAILL